MKILQTKLGHSNTDEQTHSTPGNTRSRDHFRKLLFGVVIFAGAMFIATSLYTPRQATSPVRTVDGAQEETLNISAEPISNMAVDTAGMPSTTDPLHKDISTTVQTTTINGTTSSLVEVNGDDFTIPQDENGAISTIIENSSGGQSDVHIEFESSSSSGRSSHSHSTSSLNIRTTNDEGRNTTTLQSYSGH